MVKHNKIIPNQHFHKKWQTSSRGPLHIKSWFNQPGKKRSRRLKRDAKVRSQSAPAPQPGRESPSSSATSRPRRGAFPGWC